MFDDMPKNSPLRKVFYTLLILAILGVAGYFVYQKYFFVPKEVKSANEKIINNIDRLDSETSSPSPITSVIPSTN